jgi:hypothetical protein
MRCKTPKRWLEAYDKFMSGAPLDKRENEMARRVALAASFGAEAYEKGFTPEMGAHAMVRSVLIALTNPSSSELDYLRACNQEKETT